MKTSNETLSAKEELQQLMNRLAEVCSRKSGFTGFSHECSVVVGRIFGDTSTQYVTIRKHLHDAEHIAHSVQLSPGPVALDIFRNHLASISELLESFSSQIERYGLPTQSISTRLSHIEIVENICLRFHAACKQLRKRYDGRSTIDVKDEYDVQDFLHVLLTVHFSDIRREDPAPSRAGASSRRDFVLKKERLVIECKHTRPSLTDKKLGEELVIDIERYRSSGDYDTLFCFVYDPDGYLNNPVGLENELSRENDGITSKIRIYPK